LTITGASTNLALSGTMNDLQLSQPAKAPLQNSALERDLLPEAEPRKPAAPQEEYDKYDVSRLACTE
jgi:hypothetical protein